MFSRKLVKMFAIHARLAGSRTHVTVVSLKKTLDVITFEVFDNR
jgi:hypothetical protein